MKIVRLALDLIVLTALLVLLDLIKVKRVIFAYLAMKIVKLALDPIVITAILVQQKRRRMLQVFSSNQSIALMIVLPILI